MFFMGVEKLVHVLLQVCVTIKKSGDLLTRKRDDCFYYTSESSWMIKCKDLVLQIIIGLINRRKSNYYYSI